MTISNNILKNVIFDQRENIREFNIVPREYSFEANGSYVLVGLRRAGKSTLLYKMVQDLVASGVSWEQIIYINFEDERLTGFQTTDFNNILAVQAELSNKKGYYFFDEIQNVDGWEKFARRLADAKEHVCITGSNAKMLSKDIEKTLGGRYLSKYISTYNFREFLTANKINHGKNDLYQTKTMGTVKACFDQYYIFGGFPESLLYKEKREYVSSIYQKILLGDVVARNGIRNDDVLRIMMKKIAETVGQPLSYTKLHDIVTNIGYKISKDSIINYVENAKDAFLLFDIQNYFAKLADKESNPKYYYHDNGLVNLFLVDKKSILLENIVAVTLKNKYKDDLYYLKSSKTNIDVDFYIPGIKTAVQVAYELSATSRDREIDNLVKLSKNMKDAERFIIVTYDEEDIIEKDGVKINVIPAYLFCLDNDNEY